MRSILKTTVASLATVAVMATGAMAAGHAKALEGD